jgi:hypothetical protein
MSAPLAITLVGTIGEATVQTVNTAITPPWGTGESRIAQNLLLCAVTGTGAATLPTTPSGWFIVAQVAGTSSSATLYGKIAAGADSAPTVGAATSVVWSAQLSEWTSQGTIQPIDKTGTASTASAETLSIACSAADTFPLDLMVTVVASYKSSAFNGNATSSLNQGATTSSSNNHSISGTNHYDFAYGSVATQNIASDTNTYGTWGTNVAITGLIASFRVQIAYHAPQDTLPPNAISPSDINQRHVEHQAALIYDGSVILTQTGYDAFVQPLTGIMVDQPFVMSGTELDRVELPNGPANGVGQPVTVTLYADSAGYPTGVPIAQAVVPASHVFGAKALPQWQYPLLGYLADFDAANFAPPTVSDGVCAILVGGIYNGNGSISQSVVTCTLGGLGDTVWAAQPQYPLPLLAMSLAIATDATSGGRYIVCMGGVDVTNVLYDQVYIALLDGADHLSSWQSSTVLPSAVWLTQGAASGPYVYCIGGIGPLIGSSILTSVYMATLSNGTLGAWTAVNSLPVAISSSNQAFTHDGWLIVVAGVGNATGCWAAPIHADGTLGTWQTWPTCAVADPTSALFINANGDGPCLILTGAIYPAYTTQQFWTLAFNADGPAPAWRLQQSFSPVTFFGDPMAVYESNALGTPALCCFANPLEASAWISLNPKVSLVSVPLRATGLTNGTTYHIVISGVGGITDINDSSVEIAFVHNAGHVYSPSTGWQSLGMGTGVPLWIYTNGSPPVGNMVHIVEDVALGIPARSTWLSYDYYQHLLTVGEWTTASDVNLGTNAGQWRNLSYNSDGTLSTIS